MEHDADYWAKRLERIEARVFDNHGQRLDRVEKETRAMHQRSRRWEAAATAVLDGERSLSRVANMNALAIERLTNDVAEMVTAWRSSQHDAEVRSWMLAALIAVTAFNLVATLALVFVLL